MADAEDDPALEQVATWVCAPADDVSPVQLREASKAVLVTRYSWSPTEAIWSFK